MSRLRLVVLACVGLLAACVLVAWGLIDGRYIPVSAASSFPTAHPAAADALLLHGASGYAAAAKQPQNVMPRVVDGAVVTRVMSSELQSIIEDGWAGGAAWSMRGLLHGRGRPSRYSKCPECTFVACDAKSQCSGHCK